jgi:hypothetical protein
MSTTTMMIIIMEVGTGRRAEWRTVSGAEAQETSRTREDRSLLPLS